MKALLLFILKCYKMAMSPLIAHFGVRCRFYPSCSIYSMLAIKKHGIIKGLMLTVHRLRKCTPMNFDSCIDYP